MHAPHRRVGRAFCAPPFVEVSEGEVSSQLLKAKGHLNHYPMTVLFDCGSTDDVVSEQVVQRAKLETVAIYTTRARFSSGMSHSVKSMVPGALLNIQKNHFVRDFIVTPLVGADVILGVKWFRKYKPHVLCILMRCSVMVLVVLLCCRIAHRFPIFRQCKKSLRCPKLLRKLIRSLREMFFLLLALLLVICMSMLIHSLCDVCCTKDEETSTKLH